jgi:hypothetical protein
MHSAWSPDLSLPWVFLPPSWSRKDIRTNTINGAFPSGNHKSKCYTLSPTWHGTVIYCKQTNECLYKNHSPLNIKGESFPFSLVWFLLCLEGKDFQFPNGNQ